MSGLDKRMQADLIFVTERFSVWRDHYQWFLYDFRNGRLKEDGTEKKIPRPTYHPRLEQLVDFMVEGVMREEAISLESIVERVNTHKFQIYDHMQTVLQPWGRTPAESVEKEDDNVKQP